MSNPHLEILKKMQSTLMQMHRLLMTSQKTDLENQTGQMINAMEWMQLMLTDSRFAWMKAILTLISDIDALMDNYTVSEKELPIISQDSEKLFLTGEGKHTDFFTNYKLVAQKDPDVILYHGQLRANILALPSSSETPVDTEDIRKNWHKKPRSMH